VLAQAIEVEECIGAPLPTLLHLPGVRDLKGDVGAALPARLVVERGALARHGQVQVDPVQ
jgi:hypothetical protein